MKRDIRWVFGIGLLVFCVNASAVYRLFDDFEDESADPLGGQDHWVSGGGDNRVVADPGDPNNQVLYVPSESSIVRKSLLHANTGVLDGTARMLFLRIRISQKQTFSVGLSGLTYPSEFSDFAPEIGMSNSTQNLDLRVWDNNDGHYKTLVSLTPDQWYNLWVLVDAGDNTYRLWLHDRPGEDAEETDGLAAADEDSVFAFRSGINSHLFTFYIKTAGGSSGVNFGPVYFDDIYLELSGGLNLANPTMLEEPLAGDADRNECVNMIDMGILSGSWLAGPDAAVGWEEGNFDFNDAVDLTDLMLMAQHWLEGCPGEWGE